jgi:hypothetical protein
MAAKEVRSVTSGAMVGEIPEKKPAPTTPPGGGTDF